MFVKYENKVREAYQACWTVISNVGTAQTTVTGFLVEGTHNKLKASPDSGETYGRHHGAQNFIRAESRNKFYKSDYKHGDESNVGMIEFLDKLDLKSYYM